MLPFPPLLPFVPELPAVPLALILPTVTFAPEIVKFRPSAVIDWLVSIEKLPVLFLSASAVKVIEPLPLTKFKDAPELIVIFRSYALTETLLYDK
jgi:hypothetical protein